ncbi:MAG TPA: xanthine dehydrogenase family protein molybdopterin-binding subunit [Candidatus Acidoferrales bacterium]|nr:xanthine dehydrogenase family protein molybdopterin-binding subunit [Candidatus Acidoferrales bacterium]
MSAPQAEDVPRRLVEGHGQFVNDLHLPRMLHLAIVRSPHARARVLKVRGGINSSELQANMSSVGEGAMQGSGIVHPVLASEYVNYVGQPVAAVLGDDPYLAEDKMLEVDVEYEPLKAVVDPESSLTSPPIHPDTTSNVLADFQMGKQFELPDAPVMLEDVLLNRRISPNPLEPRGLVVEYDGSRLTVWASTQSVYTWKEGLCESLQLDPKIVRVIQMDTGGAFGSKGGIYPEYVIASYAAMKMKRPVKWIETRMEHEMATNQGRGARAKMRIYSDRKGVVLGLKTDLLIDAGAYAFGMGGMAPRWIGFQITGPYVIPRVFVDAKAVYTNKVPLGPYRGAGRPEAAMFIERMMDLLADELKLDPVELRMRNASSAPYVSPLGLKLDPFKPFLESAVEELGYYERHNKESVGFSSFVLIPAAQPGESSRVVVKNGRVKVWLGGSTHGQGHDVWVRLLIGEELGVPQSIVDLEKSDTEQLDEGVGSWGSRSVVEAGTALVETARKIKAKCTEKFGKYSPNDLLTGDWDETVFHEEKGQVNSFGANLVTAYVSAEGIVRINRCVAYYDVGRPLNPSMIESQVIGGSAQAIGQVLTEEAKYDDDGQMLTATIADAGLISALTMPRVEVKLAHVPSLLPHGAKGVGESPTLGVPPAAVRAIEKLVGRRLRETPIPIEATMIARQQP